MKTTSLVIKDVTDRDAIIRVLMDEEIYDRIADDDCPERDDYVFNDIGARFIGGYLEDKLIGLVIHHDGEIHVNILKDYRKEYKRELWRGALSLINGPVFAEIPELYPSIIKFAESEGFRHTRSIKNGYRKNGVFYDVHVMEHP